MAHLRGRDDWEGSTWADARLIDEGKERVQVESYMRGDPWKVYLDPNHPARSYMPMKEHQFIKDINGFELSEYEEMMKAHRDATETETERLYTQLLQNHGDVLQQDENIKRILQNIERSVGRDVPFRDEIIKDLITHV